MIEIVVPQISEVASEIVLVRWLKSEGDYVTKGEPLFELDTDKYVVEIEAFEQGTLSEICVAEGAVVAPGQLVARLLPDGEPSETLLNPSEEMPTASTELPTREGPETPRSPRSRERTLASPKARQVAKELGVDIASLIGTGRSGVVTADDVRLASTQSATTATAQIALSPARRAVGARMQASKREVPHFYVMVDVDMDEAVRLRTECVANLGWPHAPTFTDLIVAACARALREVPEVNVRLEGDALHQRTTVDIGIAVHSDNGLVVPVVANADQFELQALAEATQASSKRARSGRLVGSDVGGRSMVVSNLGMYGVDAFIAIVDQPDPMILAAGRVTEKCVVVNGEPSARWGCTLTLSVDHRVLDGVDAARFVGCVRENLQDAFAFLGEPA